MKDYEMMSEDREKIAKWIIHESTSPIDNIEWLLKEAYIRTSRNSGHGASGFIQDWGDVLKTINDEEK